MNRFIDRSAINTSVATTSLLLEIQKCALSYFQNENKNELALASDSTALHSPISIAVVGLALTCNLIAVERNLLTRSEALSSTLKTLRFFKDSEQSKDAKATGNLGFYYHFLDPSTGRRTWNSELSTIDTALLMMGVLSCSEYFDGESLDEKELRGLAKELYCGVNWQAMLSAELSIFHGWKPKRGFLKWQWRGYNEALLLYILALGSPSCPIPKESYDLWLSNYKWIKVYETEYVYCGPLFTHQLPHCWLNLRGIQDSYMKEKGIDYFENSRRATQVQSLYCEKNPRGHESYSKYCWGLSSCDGPRDKSLTTHTDRNFFGYAARGTPYGPDDGTIAPWSVVASLPFNPELVLNTIEKFDELIASSKSNYRYPASFNKSFKSADEQYWTCPNQYGLNQGPAAIMIENHLSGFVWKLMQRCPYIIKGLLTANFRGGWLS